MKRNRSFHSYLLILSEVIFIIILLLMIKQDDKRVIADAIPAISIEHNVVLAEAPEYTIVRETEDKPERQFVSRGLPNGVSGRFKTYMDFRTITNEESDQWKLQELAVTDEEGFRKYDGKYMIAVGTHYADSCGKTLRITLDSGIVFDAIVGDIKQDRHTDSTNRYVKSNGNIIEFIVDTRVLSKTSKKMGDVSYSGLQGSVVKIEEEVK